MTDDKVIRLVPPGERKPHENVVQLLEDLLEAARLGNISGIAAAYVRPDSTARTVWCKRGCSLALTGAAGVLHHDLCREAGDE